MGIYKPMKYTPKLKNSKGYWYVWARCPVCGEVSKIFILNLRNSGKLCICGFKIIEPIPRQKEKTL